MAKTGMKVIPIVPYVFGSEEQQEIAALAFEFWLARGFRGGSPVDDLFRAARAVREATAEVPAQPFLVRKPADYPRATETEAFAPPLGSRQAAGLGQTCAQRLASNVGQDERMKYKFKDNQMAKQQKKTITSGATGAGAAAARAVEPVAEPPRPSEVVAETTALGSAPEREQIARLAYSYWQARGCPEGSPEEDWYRAEAELGKPTAGTGAEGFTEMTGAGS